MVSFGKMYRQYTDENGDSIRLAKDLGGQK